jgi:hypothetical protein
MLAVSTTIIIAPITSAPSSTKVALYQRVFH